MQPCLHRLQTDSVTNLLLTSFLAAAEAAMKADLAAEPLLSVEAFSWEAPAGSLAPYTRHEAHIFQ